MGGLVGCVWVGVRSSLDKEGHMFSSKTCTMLMCSHNAAFWAMEMSESYIRKITDGFKQINESIKPIFH